MDSSLLNLVAHEIRAPLAVIEGYVTMLRDGELEGEDRAEAMRVVEVKTRELDALADILANAARLEAAELVSQPTVFDIHQAVALAVQSVEPRARLDEATVEAFGIDNPVLVSADRDQIVRILTNLLNNALTYSTPPAHVVVQVRSGRVAEVAVIDHGIGIAVEHQARIFERFSRFGQVGHGRASGLGLGLSISRDMAELSGGELLLERSVPGEGSVFVLRMPIAGSADRGQAGGRRPVT